MQIAQVSDPNYVQTLAEIRRLIEAEPDRGTPEWDRLEALASVVEAYRTDSAEDLSDIERR